jgi:SAM-dependent methyltransferase
MTQTLLVAPRVGVIEKEIESLYHRHFSEQRRDKKLANQRKVKSLRQELGKLLAESVMSPAKAKHVAEWDPFDPQSAADFFDPHWMFGRSLADGFDVVIANPPYVRQEAIKDFKPLLKAQGYECFDGVADLFVYFYEKSVRLLRPGGVLSFITPNKYYRAGYGKKLRGFLARELTLLRLIDFGDAPVFEAIAYASILAGVRTKPKPDATALAYTWEKEMTFDGIAEVVAERGQQVFQSELKPDGWRLESPVVLRLLEKLRRAGKPLGEYVKGRFYRGILTGLNEAFVVDRDTRDRLIREHKSSAAVFKPYLRGRDVKRWQTEFADQYLIKIESSENKDHPWSGRTEKEAGNIFAATYPAIYELFETFRSALKVRSDQGKYFWELRSCAYWKQFEQTKLIVPAISGTVNVALDRQGFFSNNKSSIFVCDDAVFVSAVVNSKVAFWFTQQVFATKQGGFYDFEPRYSSQWPIPAVSPAQKKPLEHLVERILAAKQANPAADTSTLEREIDQQVYALYGLTPEEIAIVEGTAQ